MLIKTYDAGQFDVAVVGAGHAGIEAALAAARLGCRVALFTMQLDMVANLPCNPAIGGTAKGHLVREIDALGGEMGRAADACCIQYRMLNRSKGPAVRSLRAQADRRAYSTHMKRLLESVPNISLKQAEIVDIGVQDGEARWVDTALGARYTAAAVVVATGTFLKARTITGETAQNSGPDGQAPANRLSDSLRLLGLPLQRFKTGTPPRVSARSVDFSRMSPQHGDDDCPPFSFQTENRPVNAALCHLTWTTPDTHQIIRENLHRSPLYSGKIHGVGARYCPSIEDKVVRFADKERHPLFIEPTGVDSDELYIQGLSSSLPEDVQISILHSIPGLERAEVTRPAYAIEYDCLDPLCLSPALMCGDTPGLFFAGQICGTSGYEEAAAQGLIAGVNAARRVGGQPPFQLDRASSYIGTLIDDLVTRGTNEPYRMMTSRSEFRLLLRQDNADARLAKFGYELGLVPSGRFEKTLEKYRRVEEEIQRLHGVIVPPSASFARFLQDQGSAVPITGVSMADLVRRPELSYD
ncbi:MAG: tRNA uridine-5-carboxymethylaminomethyl(34) synthesis enzyme MnmG, partial [Oscillospiraceae bacterium]|nr:tRNA uridine-5-carboxymethylaminomethyl(34) synthesis enzyme MnmG [Oscillospiraceae bacterium]